MHTINGILGILNCTIRQVFERKFCSSKMWSFWLDFDLTLGQVKNECHHRIPRPRRPRKMCQTYDSRAIFLSGDLNGPDLDLDLWYHDVLAHMASPSSLQKHFLRVWVCSCPLCGLDSWYGKKIGSFDLWPDFDFDICLWKFKDCIRSHSLSFDLHSEPHSAY